ncbi:MAG: Fur family transcriptional regulator [Planctomycetota bacterium]|nr:Fur family transcriptional regulator [Planctomycetota bacterium]MDA1164378.1 Fur family transcriptional regulator [Planctomycetota bacterium]
MSDIAALDKTVSPVEKFREYLVTKGQRLTREREIIVEEVFSDHEHFDTDQLVDRLSGRNDKRRVSRATVYRALSAMDEAGLLRKVARPNGREVWEHDYGYPQHDHMVCSACGELFEFHNDEISRLIEKITSAQGFLRTSHRLEVYGTCEACRRPQKRRLRKLDLI